MSRRVELEEIAKHLPKMAMLPSVRIRSVLFRYATTPMTEGRYKALIRAMSRAVDVTEGSMDNPGGQQMCMDTVLEKLVDDGTLELDHGHFERERP